jgi:hypothetical protein
MNRYLIHCSSEALSRAEGGQSYEPEKKCRAYLGRSHRLDHRRGDSFIPIIPIRRLGTGIVPRIVSNLLSRKRGEIW